MKKVKNFNYYVTRGKKIYETRPWRSYMQLVCVSVGLWVCGHSALSA